MSKKTICESEQLLAKKDAYLNAAYEKQESLLRWKRRESARSFLKALMILLLLAGVAAAVAFWYFKKDVPLTNVSEHLYSIISLGAGILLCIICGFVRVAVSSSCKAGFAAYYTDINKAEDRLEDLKREQLDPILENSIVVSTRALLEAPVEYEYEDEDNPFDDDGDYEYVDDDAPANETEILCGSVSSALVYIDGMEVGAVDLNTNFSTFRVTPGLHSLKLKIKKDLSSYNKCIEIETPVNPISVNGDYRVVLYTLDCKQKVNNDLSYALRVTEYDDMVTFMRDIHATNADEKRSKYADLSRKLKRRARKLYRELFDLSEDEYSEQYLERALFGNEKVRFDSLAERLQATRQDAVTARTPKVEIAASVQSIIIKDENE